MDATTVVAERADIGCRGPPAMRSNMKPPLLLRRLGGVGGARRGQELGRIQPEQVERLQAGSGRPTFGTLDAGCASPLCRKRMRPV
jgi:hypothetical protein